MDPWLVLLQRDSNVVDKLPETITPFNFNGSLTQYDEFLQLASECLLYRAQGRQEEYTVALERFAAILRRLPCVDSDPVIREVNEHNNNLRIHLDRFFRRNRIDFGKESTTLVGGQNVETDEFYTLRHRPERTASSSIVSREEIPEDAFVRGQLENAAGHRITVSQGKTEAKRTRDRSIFYRPQRTTILLED
ncbi:hypothetical protein GMRT_13610 [Giardia muris]|uniref:Uncharacterized protein n=1 Tax=Giardia muris TaxID=5742 RepID=A0A4Z1SWV0_GIAMU|nr:hypothetical protein GMRT_13610 [Giardia muris]|eukprot:TNJ30030.1 hypothetical protein GMRT_13610 [Giardia muris]